MPRDEVETELCEVVSEVLHLPSIGIHDGFFDLGGHSMAAMKLVGRVRSMFEVDITIRDVFDAPTVAELAELVRSGERSAQPGITATGETGPVPLAPSQRLHWQRHRSSRSRAQSDHALALQLQEPIDAGHLALALDDVVDRHVPLRTVFAPDGTRCTRRTGHVRVSMSSTSVTTICIAGCSRSRSCGSISPRRLRCGCTWCPTTRAPRCCC